VSDRRDLKKYPQIEPGQWVKPKRKYYRMMCCDCGLVHKFEFALVKWPPGFAIQLRGWRDNRALRTPEGQAFEE